MTVRYTPKKEMLFPDMLPRLGSVEGTEIGLDKSIHMLTFSNDWEKRVAVRTLS